MPAVTDADMTVLEAVFSSPMRASKPPLLTNDNTLSTTLKLLKDVGEALQHIPYIKAVAGISIQILEIREQISSHKSLAHDLIDRVGSRSRRLMEMFQRLAQVQDVDKEHLRNELGLLEHDFQDLERLLVDIFSRLSSLKATLRGPMQIFRRESIKQELQSFIDRLEDFDQMFNFTRLSTIEINIARLHSSSTASARRRKCAADLLSAPPSSPVFTGRDDILEAIHAYFSINVESSSGGSGCQRRFVLYGLGGSGKTQIVLKFLEQSTGRFSRIFFIDASTTDQISLSLQDLGSELGLIEPSSSDTLASLSRLNEDWLVVLDNADDPGISLNDYLPRCNHGNILITTRNRECTSLTSDARASCHVAEMSPPDAMALLAATSRLPPTIDQAPAQEIIKELGFLALAMTQAGSFIANSVGLDYATYLAMYRESRADLLQTRTGQRLDSYQHTVFTTWEMSFGKLSGEARSLLEVSAFLSREGVSSDLFRRAGIGLAVTPLSADSSVHQATADFLRPFCGDKATDWSSFAFQRAINELTSYSLVTPTGRQTYSIHPLVHAWARDRLVKQKAKRKSNQELALYIIFLSVDDDEIMLESHYNRRSALSHLIGGGYDLFSSEHPEYAFRFAWLLRETARWSEASKLLEMGLAYLRGKAGEQCPEALRTRTFLAYTWFCQGQFAKAEAELNDVFEIQRIDGESRDDHIKTMETLALVYVSQGNYVKAENLQLEVLAYHNKHSDPTHSGTRSAMHNLAWTYYEQSRFLDAERLQQEVLEGDTSSLGLHNPNTLSSKHNLALTYSAQMRHEEARTLLEEVLEGTKRLLGPEHRAALIAMNNLSLTYSALQMLQEAHEMCEDVLRISLRIHGPHHPQTLTSIHNLATTLSNQEKYREAEPLQVQVIQERELLLGPEHPDTLRSMLNLGGTLSRLGRLDEAEKLQLRVLEIRRKVLGLEHPSTFLAAQLLADTYLGQDRHHDVIALLEEVAPIQRSTLGSQDPDAITALHNLALAYYHVQRHDDARRLQEQVLDLRVNVQGEDHVDTLKAMRRLAETYRRQGLVDEIHSLQMRALRYFQKEHPDVIAMLQDSEYYQPP